MSGLSDEQAEAFRTVGVEITDWAYDSAAANEEEYLVEMRKNAEVNTVDFESFQKKVQPVYEAYVDNYTDDWLNDVKAAR